MEDDRGIKVVLLGESGVGKTNLIRVSTGKGFEKNENSTITSAYYEEETYINKKRYSYFLWDTAGQEIYRSLNKIFIKDSKIVMIVFAINSKQSFEQIDFWYKYVRDILGDDGYIIADSKEKLIFCMKKLKDLCSILDIEPNLKKTHIFKMNGTMEFLKARVRMYNDGHITIKPNRKNITRNRKKIKKLKTLYENDIVLKESVNMIFKTTYGNFKNFNAYHSKRNYKKLYDDLFCK